MHKIKMLTIHNCAKILKAKAKTNSLETYLER